MVKHHGLEGRSGGGGTSTYTTPSEVCVLQLRTLLYFWKQMAQDHKAYSADTRYPLKEQGLLLTNLLGSVTASVTLFSTDLFRATHNFSFRVLHHRDIRGRREGSGRMHSKATNDEQQRRNRNVVS